MKQKKNYYWALLIFFIMVSCLNMVKKEDKPNEGSLTVIPITDITGIMFYDTSTLSASLLQSGEIPDVISSGKKEKGDLFNVIIKRVPYVEKGIEVDLIDALKENNIKNYVISDVNKKDIALMLKFLNALKPPEPISLRPPGSINLDELPDNPYFYIKVNKNGVVRYKTDSAELNDSFIDLPKNDSLGLSKAIAEYILSRAGNSKEFIVDADGDVKYSSFELVINALKENNIYKYQLLTTEKEAKELKLLMPKEEK